MGFCIKLKLTEFPTHNYDFVVMFMYVKLVRSFWHDIYDMPIKHNFINMDSLKI